MPLELAAIIGDVVHNIRSALDFAAVALTVPPLGTGNVNDAAFPTGKNREIFETEKRRKMKGASPDALRFVEELEPYDGGQHSVRELHDLDILDKHKLLIPAMSVLHVRRMNASFRDKPLTLSGADFQAITDGSVDNFVATVDCPGITSSEEFKLHDNLDATFLIVFGKGQPLQRQPVVPTLTQICDLVKRFIETCEMHFLKEV